MKTISLHFSEDDKTHLLILPIFDCSEGILLLEEFERFYGLVYNRKHILYRNLLDFYSALCAYANYVLLYQDSICSIYLVVYTHVLLLPEIQQSYTRVILTNITCRVYFSDWSQVNDFVSLYAKSLIETETLPA